MALGLWDDAHALLARHYPVAGVVAEAGMVLPQDYPLVAYYRGYCALKMGRSGRDDFALASADSGGSSRPGPLGVSVRRTT